jgi:hypothetical protein
MLERSTAAGNIIGTARVRNLTWDSGEPGTPNAIYRLYLFDIKMVAGKAFKDVKGLQIGSTAGVADAVQDYDATTNTNITILNDTTQGSSLIVSTGSEATATISNLNYVYRQTNETLSLANTGATSLLLTDPTETFAYESASLTDTEKKTLIMVPAADVVFTPNTGADGTAAVTTGSNTVTISSAAVNKYSIGDYIALFSASSTYVMRRVTNKTATTLQLDTNLSFSNTTANFSHAYPKNVPFGLHRVTGATVTLTGGSKTINIALGTQVKSAAAITCALTYDVKVTGASPQAKTADRDNLVKIDLTAATLDGPWCLGIPDIFRVKGVFLGTSSSVNVNSTDVTDQFFIDHNQSSDFYGLGYLFKRTDANITLSASSWLLVQFDAFTSTPGVFTLNSYVSSNTAQRFVDDSLALASLGTKTNSFEVPELYTASGKYIDLLNAIDFRPVAANTAAYSKTSAGATTNPSGTVTFSGTSKKFPLPESGVQYNRDSFLGRKDLVLINTDNQVKIMRGTPKEAPEAPSVPTSVLFLNRLNIPPYPCVADKFSTTMKAILDKKMSNEQFLLKRIKDRTITVEADAAQRALQQPKGYTMSEIGQLERRIKDLEYNVALSLVESDLKDRVIPSVASPGLNRFKFGFFVDDYSTVQFSDTEHVEYRAEVVDSKVVPIALSTGTPHGPQDPSTPLCVGDLELVKQDLASLPPVPAPAPSPTPAPSPSPSSPPAAPPPAPVVVPKEVSLFRSETTTGRAKVSDTGWIQFSSVPSTYRVDYNFFALADELKIEKRNSAGVVTVIRASADLIRTGVLNFNHDPSTGREYKLTTTFKSTIWQYTLYYPIDSTIFVDPTAPSTNVGTTFYDGALISITPGTITTPAMYQNFGETAYVSLGITQTLLIASLKPSTTHYITVGDSSTAIVAKPIITTGTGSVSNSASITTDAFGKTNFRMLVDNTVVDNLKSLTGHVYNSGVPSSLYVRVASADNTSICEFVMKFDTGVATSNTLSGSYGSPVIGGGGMTRNLVHLV